MSWLGLLRFVGCTATASGTAAALEDRAGRWFQQYVVVVTTVARSVPYTLAWNLAGPGFGGAARLTAS